MKRFILIGVVALPMLALAQQPAAAGHQICIDFSITIGCSPECSCPRECKLRRCRRCDPCNMGCYSGSDGYAGYDSGGTDGFCPDGYGGSLPSYAQFQIPTYSPVQDPGLSSFGSGYQPVGYFQAPSYWYGR
jgi:hypothetical protein